MVLVKREKEQKDGEWQSCHVLSDQDNEIIITTLVFMLYDLEGNL